MNKQQFAKQLNDLIEETAKKISAEGARRNEVASDKSALLTKKTETIDAIVEKLLTKLSDCGKLDWWEGIDYQSELVKRNNRNLGLLNEFHAEYGDDPKKMLEVEKHQLESKLVQESFEYEDIYKSPLERYHKHEGLMQLLGRNYRTSEYNYWFWEVQYYADWMLEDKVLDDLGKPNWKTLKEDYDAILGAANLQKICVDETKSKIKENEDNLNRYLAVLKDHESAEDTVLESAKIALKAYIAKSDEAIGMLQAHEDSEVRAKARKLSTILDQLKAMVAEGSEYLDALSEYLKELQGVRTENLKSKNIESISAENYINSLPKTKRDIVRSNSTERRRLLIFENDVPQSSRGYGNRDASSSNNNMVYIDNSSNRRDY